MTMKRCVAYVLQVVAILALSGSSLGDQDGGAEILSRPCSATRDNEDRVTMKVIVMGMQCFATTGTDESLVLSYETLEDHKEFFKSYCGKQPQILECLADVARTSQSCQNQTRHQTFQVFRELLETTLEAGCVQDGEVLANMVMVFKHKPTCASPNVFYECLATNVQKVSLSLRIPFSDLSMNYMLFRDIKRAKKCFNDIKGGDQHVKNGIVNLLNVFVEKYKCLDPQDDSVVLCKDLHANHIAGYPKVCPIKSANEQTKPLYETFLNRLLFCLQASLHDEIQTVDDIADWEKSRIFFKHLCDKKTNIFSCFTDTTSLSASCLDDSHQLMMSTVEDFIKNALDHACHLVGRRHLARVATTIVRDVANSTKRNYLDQDECRNELFPSPEGGSDITSEKALEYFNKIKTFKRCLINKLQGDDIAVSTAEIVLYGVIANMKCPDPEHTTLVLCNTLANKV